MLEKVKYTEIFISENELTRLIIILQNGFTVKGVIPAQWVYDMRKLQDNAVKALIQLNGPQMEELSNG